MRNKYNKQINHVTSDDNDNDNIFILHNHNYKGII